MIIFIFFKKSLKTICLWLNKIENYKELNKFIIKKKIMKSNKMFKKIITLLFCAVAFNACKKDSNNVLDNDTKNNSIKINNLLSGSNQNSSSKLAISYRLFPNVNIYPVGGSTANRLQPDANPTCPIKPGLLANYFISSYSVGYSCSGALEVNFIIGLEYWGGNPPGGAIVSVNGVPFPAQELSISGFGDAKPFLVEHVPFSVIGNPCQSNNVVFDANSGPQVCNINIPIGVLSFIMSPQATSNSGSWQPSTYPTNVVGQAKLFVPILICYTNPCALGTSPFTNYTFRYKLQGTSTWTQVTVTYVQSQLGYIVNSLPAGVYDLEGRDSPSNPWVTGGNGGTFNVL